MSNENRTFKCPKCNGTGKVTLTKTPNAFSKPVKSLTHTKKCFFCEGTGKI
jgi:hypothetical protein